MTRTPTVTQTSIRADVDGRLSGLIHTLANRYRVKVQVVAGALLAHAAKDKAWIAAWKPPADAPVKHPPAAPRRLPEAVPVLEAREVTL